MKNRRNVLAICIILCLLFGCGKNEGQTVEVSETVSIIEGTYIVRAEDREKKVIENTADEENAETIEDKEEVTVENKENVGNKDEKPETTVSDKTDSGNEKPSQTSQPSTPSTPTTTTQPSTPSTSTTTSQPSTPSTSVHTHSYTSSVTTSPSCSTEGIKTYYCSCGHSYTESIPCTSHNYVETITEATCTSEGDITKRCQSCGHVIYTQGSPALGHDYVSNVVINPTCEENGSSTATCNRCGKTEVYEIAPRGHSWSTSTYTLNGVKITEVKCSWWDCNAVQSRTEEPLSGSGSILDEDNQSSIDDEFANLGNLVP